MTAPVILFDGVCNLCHAAVAWILEHDTKQEFRFASLQSAAARDVLAAAGPVGDLPDSVVLVDERGVHTRSDAALGVARRLGFPWSLLMLAAPLPRFLRDAVYAWVARNRYRWFGRRDSCLRPTPELAGRFLDAGETIQVPPAAPAPRTQPGALQLFVYAYLFVYIFPFPLSGVPGAASVTAWYDGAWHRAIQWVAIHLLHVNASVLPAGSGDTTYNYVETLVDGVLALFVAAGAWRWRRDLDLTDGVRTYVRYFLGGVLLSYGWHKLFPLQMMTPGPDRLVALVADKSPMGVVWMFIGLSPAYQMLCGLVEVLGGALLLFRRTALLGALLGAAAMAQVVALNFCYDVPVKLFSSHLLLCALFLLAPDVPRLLSFLLGGPAGPAAPLAATPRSAPSRRTLLRRALKGAMVGVFLILPMITSYGEWRRRQALDLGPLHGYYAVLSFQSAAGEGERRWVRVGFNGAYRGVGILRADGQVKRHGYAVTAEQLTFELGKDQRAPMTYRPLGPESFLLEGAYDGAPVKVILRRIPAPLTSRGFHWVNERPFHQ